VLIYIITNLPLIIGSTFQETPLYYPSLQNTVPFSKSLVITKHLAFSADSLIVAVLVSPPTKAAKPVRFNAGPYAPVLKEYVVAQVGHARRGMSLPNA